jgi:hypothetical protein
MNLDQTDAISQAKLAEQCQLKIFDYKPSLVIENVVALENKVITKSSIPSDQFVCMCYPVITYYQSPEMTGESLFTALSLKPSSYFEKIMSHLFQLYPREEDDMLKSFSRICPSSNITLDMAKQMIRQREHIIMSYCYHNAFSVDDQWYLYIEASRFNHSCDPNCEWEIVDNVLSIKSVKQINDGDELTISYGVDGDYNRDVEGYTNGCIRRNYLMKLHFYCQCPLCINRCNTCDNVNPNNKCSTCKLVKYCSRECQIKDWKDHKALCKRIV